MSSYLLMHVSTLNYLKNNLDSYKVEAKIGGLALSDINIRIAGFQIYVENFLNPTIIEPDYVFPNNRFITYEDKDREWCEPLGIGKPGIKQIGDIILMKDGIPSPFVLLVRKTRAYTSYDLIKNGIY